MEKYLNKIIHGDCLEIMKQLPDKSIDVVLTDPPYGIGEDSYRVANRDKLAKSTDYGKFDWDKKIGKEYIDEIVRVSKNQIIFGGNYYANWLSPSSCWIVWDKDNSGDFADCELAWTSFPLAVRKFRYRWNGMLQEDMKNKEKRYHPTQKPVALFKWILSKYSKEGDIVLDPFLGSGTAAIAARELHRDYIGIDISKEYCDIAEMRLQQQLLL